jgi:hypothetical protein
MAATFLRNLILVIFLKTYISKISDLTMQRYGGILEGNTPKSMYFSGKGIFLENQAACFDEEFGVLGIVRTKSV